MANSDVYGSIEVETISGNNNNKKRLWTKYLRNMEPPKELVAYCFDYSI